MPSQASRAMSVNVKSMLVSCATTERPYRIHAGIPCNECLCRINAGVPCNDGVSVPSQCWCPVQRWSVCAKSMLVSRAMMERPYRIDAGDACNECLCQINAGVPCNDGVSVPNQCWCPVQRVSVPNQCWCPVQRVSVPSQC